MTDDAYIALFVPLTCIVLSFASKHYCDYRRRDNVRRTHITALSIGVYTVTSLACLASAVHVLFSNMDGIIVGHAFLANMLTLFLIANYGYSPEVPREKRFVLSQHLGVGMRTTIGHYPSISSAMRSADYIIKKAPESHLVITDLDDKKIVVINPPNSLG